MLLNYDQWLSAVVSVSAQLDSWSCPDSSSPADGLLELAANVPLVLFSLATCPGRWLATAELLIVTAHLIRNFDFGTDVALHEKLPDEGDDTKFGAPCKAGTGEIVKLTDLDGKSYNIVMPNMENSGTLFLLARCFRYRCCS